MEDKYVATTHIHDSELCYLRRAEAVKRGCLAIEHVSSKSFVGQTNIWHLTAEESNFSCLWEVQISSVLTMCFFIVKQKP